MSYLQKQDVNFKFQQPAMFVLLFTPPPGKVISLKVIHLSAYQQTTFHNATLTGASFA
jgi:hypothetical protein